MTVTQKKLISDFLPKLPSLSVWAVIGYFLMRFVTGVDALTTSVDSLTRERIIDRAESQNKDQMLEMNLIYQLDKINKLEQSIKGNVMRMNDNHLIQSPNKDSVQIKDESNYIGKNLDTTKLKPIKNKQLEESKAQLARRS